MLRELNPSLRTLMTPGPVEAEPRVLRAMTIPIIGQFDPEFLTIMDETMELLRNDIPNEKPLGLSYRRYITLWAWRRCSMRLLSLMTKFLSLYLDGSVIC